MELFVFRTGEVADWLQNCRGIIGEHIRVARLIRNISLENISKHLNISEQDFSDIENGTYVIDENLLTNILRALLCSRDFILCNSGWLLAEKSSRITKENYQNSCLSSTVVSNRFEELILIDRINTSNLKRMLSSSEQDGLNGTNNLNHIKKYATLLNCSWQYLAGLTPFRWSEDIACKSPQTQSAILYDTILNHVKAYYFSLDTTHKEVFDIKIGERIRKLRETRGFSQSDVAEYMNISHQALSKFESGETSLINNSHLFKLAEALQCSYEYILYATDTLHGTGVYNLSAQEICYSVFPVDSFKIETSDFLREQNLKRYVNRHNIALSKAFTSIVDKGSNSEKKLALDMINSLLKYIDKNQKDIKK